MSLYIGFLSFFLPHDRADKPQQKATLVTNLRDRVANFQNRMLEFDRLTSALERMSGEATMLNEERLSRPTRHSELPTQISQKYFEDISDLSISEILHFTTYWQEMQKQCTTPTLKTAVQDMDKHIASLEAEVEILGEK
ncbi:MAG: hypothetical protein Q9191_007607 [Dirinaria sp. TL-2023a]